MVYSWHLYLMAVLYVLAGLFHFIKPKLYLQIMPEYLPAHLTLVYGSGLGEIIAGIALCVPQTHVAAVYGVIAMLICFLPVHLAMLLKNEKSMGLPKWMLVFRLLLQFGLMFWAYQYLK